MSKFKLTKKLLDGLMGSDVEYKDKNITITHYNRYINYISYKGIKIISYEKDDHVVCIYGSDEPYVRTLQNLILVYFDIKVIKVRLRDRTNIKSVTTNIRMANIGNHHGDYYRQYIGKPLFNSELNDLFSSMYETNDCMLSKYILNNSNNRGFDKLRGVTIDDSYEYVTFIPAMKPYIEKYRQKIKIGKLIKKLYSNDFTESQIELIVNRIKSRAPLSYSFKVVSGSDINKYYSSDHYESGCSSLGASCMKDRDWDYFDIYSQNDACSMLILVNDEEMIIGRALLWQFECGRDDENYKLMDRAYGTDSTIVRFKNWAKQNEFWTKERQSYDYKRSWIDLDGNVINKLFQIPMETSFSYYPYIDTFTYISDDYISNDEDDWDVGEATGAGGNLG